MLRWFHALMPKEERFFDAVRRACRAVVAGAEALRAMLEGGDAIAHNYQIVMDREHDADNATREVLIAVRRTFITPFDRGNIRDLITAMDNSIDQMQKTAKAVKLFDVTSFTTAAEGHGGRDREMRAAGAGRLAAAADRSAPRPSASAPSPSRFRRWRAAPTSSTTSGCGSSTWPTPPAEYGPGFLRRQRGLRPSGKGGRPLRRRRQRDARHRHRARLISGRGGEHDGCLGSPFGC